MLLILLLLFVVLPIAEIFVFFQMADAVGFFSAVGWIILVSIVGVWLVKRQGLHAIRRANQKVAAGEVPAREMVNGILILGAGALMLFPGFLTDIAAILLLLPPVRAVFAAPLLKRFKAGPISMGTMGGPFGGGTSRFSNDTIVDAESWDVTDQRPRKELP